ncbi:MAG: cell division protein ZapD [Ottowia sp.]|nr:cell division protein ZapD [Ottowia sp.]
MSQYEYPFNERVRTLLRLEHLFERFAFFLRQEDAYQHHIAITTLFEISDVSSRADLKVDMIKELERQRIHLAALRNNVQINLTLLDETLDNFERAQRNITDIQGKASQHLTESEWLSALRSRTIIPGGTCEFDLPAYHAWRRTSATVRRLDIEKWAAPFLPLRDGTCLLLQLLRSSSRPSQELAIRGNYQQTLAGKTYQLMQVVLDDANLIPEISANKYMQWIRIMQLDGTEKPKQVDYDVPFQLTLCSY